MDANSGVTFTFGPKVSDRSEAVWRCRFSLLAPVRTAASPFLFNRNKFEYPL